MDPYTVQYLSNYDAIQPKTEKRKQPQNTKPKHKNKKQKQQQTKKNKTKNVMLDSIALMRINPAACVLKRSRALGKANKHENITITKGPREGAKATLLGLLGKKLGTQFGRPNNCRVTSQGKGQVRQPLKNCIKTPLHALCFQGQNQLLHVLTPQLKAMQQLRRC